MSGFLVGECRAVTFEELFQGILAMPWEDYLPKDCRFWVTKASSVKSRLYSTPDIQSIAKKAMVERMKRVYRINRFPETGEDYPVRIFFMKDVATVMLDTTGTPLHKRGYRTLKSQAPISETMAAALLLLTPWHDDRILYDPFCGSGTFPIEAAMMAANIAPVLDRHFTAEGWENLISKNEWKAVRSDARSGILSSPNTFLYGSDVDPEMVEIAKKNADRAGVGELTQFSVGDVAEVKPRGEYGFLVTNPPYGERLSDQEELPSLYGAIGNLYRSLPTWSLYVITSYEDAERYIGKTANKNRKLYNGMIKTWFYQYWGPKP